MKRLVAAAFTVILLSTPIWAATQTTTLKVPGMTCPVCPITVKRALQTVPGVLKVEVDYAQKEVAVTFDNAKTRESDLTKATADVGFPSQTMKSIK